MARHCQPINMALRHYASIDDEDSPAIAANCLKEKLDTQFSYQRFLLSLP